MHHNVLQLREFADDCANESVFFAKVVFGGYVFGGYTNRQRDGSRGKSCCCDCFNEVRHFALHCRRQLNLCLQLCFSRGIGYAIAKALGEKGAWWLWLFQHFPCFLAWLWAVNSELCLVHSRQGYAIGAKVLVSSRKESNVKDAVESLKSIGLEVAGIPAHAANDEDRKNLFVSSERNPPLSHVSLVSEALLSA